MGLDPQGVAGASLAEQLALIWSNLRAILAQAGVSVADIVRATSYLRDVAHVEASQEARLAVLGAHLVPTTAIVVQTLRDDWLVEIEIVAAAE